MSAVWDAPHHVQAVRVRGIHSAWDRWYGRLLWALLLAGPVAYAALLGSIAFAAINLVAYGLDWLARWLGGL